MTSVKHFRTLDGGRVALVGEAARVYTKLVYIDTPIKVHKVPNGDVALYTHEIMQGAKPVKTTARKMLKAGKRLGITKGARKWLRAVITE